MLVHVLQVLHLFGCLPLHPGQGQRHVGVKGPAGVRPLVQIHQHCVLGGQLVVKHTLHVAVGSCEGEERDKSLVRSIPRTWADMNTACWFSLSAHRGAP